MVNTALIYSVSFRGRSREVLRSFPKSALLKFGKEFTRLQMGLQPTPGRFSSLNSIADGVMEIRITDTGESYRAIYVSKFGDKFYVLHSFHKKSHSGSEIPREHVNMITRAWKDLMTEIGAIR